MRGWQALVFMGRVGSDPCGCRRAQAGPSSLGSAPSGSSTYGARRNGGCGAAGGSCTLGSAAFLSGGRGLAVDAPPLPAPPACAEAPGRMAQAGAFPGWTQRSRGVQGAWVLVLSQLSMSTRACPPPHPTPPWAAAVPGKGRTGCPHPDSPAATARQPRCPPHSWTSEAARSSPPLQWSPPCPVRAQSVPQKPEASSQTLGVTCRSDGRLLLL